jgi:hypothetical protein
MGSSWGHSFITKAVGDRLGRRSLLLIGKVSVTMTSFLFGSRLPLYAVYLAGKLSVLGEFYFDNRPNTSVWNEYTIDNASM